jgi:hypothetical protein
MNHQYPSTRPPATPMPKRQSGAQNLANVPLPAAPALSQRPRGGDTAVLRTAEQKKTVREVRTPHIFRIHARTLVLSVCLAAGLAFMNYRAPAIMSCKTVQKELGGSKVTSYFTEIRGRGWPLTQLQTVETSDPILAMQEFRKAAPAPIGMRNILICLALVLGTGVLCEFLTRRSEADQDAAML